MKNAAKEYIETKIEEIKVNDKDDWNIAYGMISMAFDLGLITNDERKRYLRDADRACFGRGESGKQRKSVG